MFRISAPTKELSINTGAADALKLFTRSLELSGRVKSAELIGADGFRITGKMSYGFQRVPVSITLPEDSLREKKVLIDAKSDDVKAEGAKQCIERLVHVYHTLSSGNSAEINDMIAKDYLKLGTGVTGKKLLYSLFIAVLIAVLVYLSVAMLMRH